MDQSIDTYVTYFVLASRWRVVIAHVKMRGLILELRWRSRW
jgi:hypothetical protein